MVNRHIRLALGLAVIILAMSATSAFALPITPQPSPHPMIRAGPSTSTNWSGYAVTGSSGSVSEVQGSWIVPSVTATASNSYSAFWVGIDGYNSNTVEQIGTSSDYVNGAPSYYAWYEFYPNPPVTIPITIKVGDTISASVTYTGTSTTILHGHKTSSSSTFTVTITDGSQIFTTTGKVSNAARSSAEWIAEAPSSGGVLPLADFGTVSYGYDFTNIPTTCYATINGVTGTIGSFGSNVQTITMVDSTGTTIAQPSSLTNNQSFTVERITSSSGTSGTLSVLASTDKSTYSRGSTASITITVTDSTSGNVISGASVTVTVTAPNGAVASGSGTTNSAGQATFRYNIRHNAPTGIYNVGAIASATGYTTGSDTTSFTVN